MQHRRRSATIAAVIALLGLSQIPLRAPSSAAAPSAGLAVGFGPLTTYTVGLTPTDLVATDLSGDGRPDLACVDSRHSQLDVYLNTGTGRFRHARTISVADGFHYSDLRLAAADFNGDGHRDLAVTDGAGSLTILLGRGDGTFVAHRHALIPGTVALRVADVNHDHRADLLMALDDRRLGVLLGRGDGTFAPLATYDTGVTAAPYGMAVTDMNSDGNLDVVLAARSPARALSMLPGRGDGTFSPAKVYRLARGISTVAMCVSRGGARMARQRSTTGYHVIRGSYENRLP